jgi:ribosomal-protein-alanine N-acetyltransferase
MFVLSDSRKAYENWMSDEDVTEFLTWNAHANPETSAAMISSWIRSYEAGTMDWCITLKSNREPIGSITAVQDFPGRRYCELGYCIAKDCWGKGYMTEAVRGVTEHIFRNTDYLWVQARCDSENFGSRRCLEKCGYEHAADLCLPCAKRNGEIRKCHMMRIERRDIIRI